MMDIRQLIAVLITGWFCTCLSFSGMPSAAASAAPQSPRLTKTDVAQSPAFSAIETFLHAVPNDYYTVKQIGTLKAAVNTQNALLIDVREPAEFDAGHIEGALNMPLRSLTDRLNQIPQKRPIILYCSSGYRSAMGVMSLHMLGYENVKGFPPSIQGWKAAGERLVSADT